MAGSVYVVPTCGNSISSPLLGAEASCSSYSNSYRQRASCSRPLQSYDSFLLSVSSRAFPSLSRRSWDGRSHLGDVQLLRFLTGKQLMSKQGSLGRVQASLLGVGAPEALVIAVVALLVFGPKGLAEVARTLGKSLKAFQPTIQELQQVSREFKSTLEQEIGLDELRNPPKPLETSGRPNSQPSNAVNVPPESEEQPFSVNQPLNGQGAPEKKAYTSEDYVRVTAEQAKALVPEELRQEAERAAWGQTPPKKSVEEGTGSPQPEEKKNEESAN